MNGSMRLAAKGTLLHACSLNMLSVKLPPSQFSVSAASKDDKPPKFLTFVPTLTKQLLLFFLPLHVEQQNPGRNEQQIYIEQVVADLDTLKHLS